MEGFTGYRYPTGVKIIWVGLLIGFLLNLTGWLGNNILLGSMWEEVGISLDQSEWRSSIWRDIFSLLPDFVYGFAIAWLYDKFRSIYPTFFSASIRTGVFVSLVGGITTYFAVANSGFIPWNLATASFGLVLATKIPLAILAGYLLSERK